MATLQTQYLLYLNENPSSSLSFEEWMSQVWEPKLSKFTGVSDNFQIGPDGAYEHIEYSIPIYENGIKTEWTVDGIVGDEKYYQLLELGNGKDLPDIINTTTKK